MCRLNLENHLAQYDYWADKFQQLPLYFMGFYGPADISTVIEVYNDSLFAVYPSNRGVVLGVAK